MMLQKIQKNWWNLNEIRRGMGGTRDLMKDWKESGSCVFEASANSTGLIPRVRGRREKIEESVKGSSTSECSSWSAIHGDLGEMGRNPNRGTVIFPPVIQILRCFPQFRSTNRNDQITLNTVCELPRTGPVVVTMRAMRP